MRRLLRIAMWGAVGLIALIAVLLVVASIAYSPALVSRMVRWGDADVYDYQKFPSRPVDNSGFPFEFQSEPNEDRVRELFEREDKIDQLEEFLASTGTQAFIVIQDDKVLYEGYFNGAKRDSIVTSFSMAKSFVSALIGIAISEGHIDSVDDPITKYIPELISSDERFADITVRELLMMSSGIRYSEGIPYMDDARTYYHPDLRALALDQAEIVGPPGEVFVYNNYHPLLLGLILERSTGVAVADYLQTRIWEPLGMEYPASWSLDSDASGFEKMESGINARAIDFAKFGRLFLENGNWLGDQIIPESWVQDSVTEDPLRTRSEYYDQSFGPEIRDTAMGGFYKYMWYGYDREGRPNDFLAEGDKGQFIYVSPDKRIIIVRNGEKFGIPSPKWIDAFYGFTSDF